MANPYLKLFSHPGGLAFSAAAWVARMPISMTGIGIITMLSQTSGSYWLAGAVAATFTFSMALLAPQVSRAVDRYGQRRVLPAATALSVTAMLALLFCSWAQWPVWTLFVSAALAGCMPSMSAMSRARWTEIYRGTPQLHTAFSLESVLDEVCFIVGPPIAVGLSVAAFPQADPCWPPSCWPSALPPSARKPAPNRRCTRNPRTARLRCRPGRHAGADPGAGGAGRHRRRRGRDQRCLRPAAGTAGGGQHCVVGVRDRLLPGRLAVRRAQGQHAAGAALCLGGRRRRWPPCPCCWSPIYGC